MSFRLRQSVIALALILGAEIYYAASAQENTALTTGSFLIRSWQSDQGLPNNTVNAITQTHDGYLWLGTDAGLVRFDGVNCRVYGLQDGLGVLQISALLEDSLGNLWIGTIGGGLSRLSNGKIKTFTIQDGLLGNTIQALLETTNGEVWVGTPTGLCRWHDGHFEPVAEGLRSVFVYDLAKDGQGDVLAATLHEGLLRFHGGQVFTNLNPVLAQNFNPRCVLMDHDGRIWVGLREQSIACYENGVWTHYGTNDGLPEVVIGHLAQTADGTIWAGSLDEGLYYFRDGSFHVLRKSDGLSDDAICSLFADGQHLWMGSRSGGLSRIGPKRLSVYHVVANSSECQLRSLAQTTNGELWLATYGQGLYNWHGEQFSQPLKDRSIMQHLFVEAVLGARDGSLWWGAGPSLFEWNGGKLNSDFKDASWLVGDRVWCLCEDRTNGIWVGTFNGQLGLVKDGKFNSVTGLFGRPVTSLAQEADETLWFGTLGSGLGHLQKGKLTFLTTKDGLRSSLIRCLYLDADGSLWIGTDGGGLSRWAHGHLTNFAAQPSLPDDTILQIVEDDTNDLWLGCNHGIYRVYKPALNEVADGRISTLHTLYFGRSDGMPSETCVGNFGASLKTQDGQICFLTEKGIVVINPLQQANNSVPPKVLLEEVLLDGEPWDETRAQPGTKTGNDPLKIPVGRHNFDFQYTGFSYDAPELIHFKYRLKGLDADWVDAQKNHDAHYNYLAPGQYQFQVMACNGGGIWSPDAATVSFIVQPFFWQTIWFRVLLAVSALGVFGGLIRIVELRRYRARLKRLEQERALTSERERIARDLHDELGSSLARISVLSDPSQLRDDSPEQFKERVKKISAFAVRTARSLDEIVWAVNPQNDSLRNLLLYLTQFADELFEDTNIRCRFHIQDNLPRLSLPPETRHNLFLTVKECLNNVLKHSRATEVTLRASLKDGRLEIIVEDNGAGFDLASVTAQSQRNGLKNMQQRLASIGGQLVIEASPERGTAVQLMVNCSPEYKQKKTASTK